MDGIANVAKQQQTQTNAQGLQGRSVEQNQQVEVQKQDLVKQAQDSTLESNKPINSKEEMQQLADKLNEALSPMSTNLKFGVDQQDIFYVSVVEAKTNKMIRRFPAEEAQQLLPKMKEVSGILFDKMG